MKANAPEKLYVDVHDNLSDSILYGFTEKRTDDDIEYIRTDTLEMKEVDEEPTSNDLEAEFVLYLKHKFNIPQEGNTLKTDGWSPSPYDLLDIAKHFAQWQKKQTIYKACNYFFSHMGLCVTFFDDDIVEDIERSEFIKKFRITMEDKT